MLKITLPVAAAASPLRAWPKTSRWPKELMSRSGGTAIGTVGGMTQTSPSASAQVASPSAHENAAAW